MKGHPSSVCAATVILALAPSARAQWSDDPNVNLALADRPGEQTQVLIAPTADGGAYVMPSAWPAWLGLLLIAMLGVFFASQLRNLRDDADQRKSLAGQLGKGSVSEFLPRTRQDLRWFIILSITAGICEEILFRGFLIWYFEQISVIALAVVFSSILFGLAHSYQGWQGGLRAGLMGLVLALSYVLSGSLWVPIFLHIAGDIYAGTLGWLAFAEENESLPGA